MVERVEKRFKSSGREGGIFASALLISQPIRPEFAAASEEPIVVNLKTSSLQNAMLIQEDFI